jgi:hypothetical protein
VSSGSWTGAALVVVARVVVVMISVLLLSVAEIVREMVSVSEVVVSVREGTVLVASRLAVTVSEEGRHGPAFTPITANKASCQTKMFKGAIL